MADSEVTPVVVLRQEAKKLGIKRYYTGEQCKYGHVDFRTVSNGVCSECARIKSKKFRDANPDLISIINKRSYYNNRYSYLAKNKRWMTENADKRSEYRKRNSDRWRVNNKKYYEINKDQCSERNKRWRAKNLDRIRAYQAKSRTQKRHAGGTHTSADLADILKAQRHRCAYCRKKLGKGYHVDHITPLARYGRNDRANLQMLCAQCNLSKAARDPVDHARTLGLLI